MIVIRVPRAERTSRPVYVGSDPRTGTYRRSFEGDYHCSIDEVSLMIRDSALVTDDNKLLTDLDASVFCPDTVKSYRNIFKLIRQNHLWNKEDDAMFLRTAWRPCGSAGPSVLEHQLSFLPQTASDPPWPFS